jgi:hypothetical protein
MDTAKLKTAIKPILPPKLIKPIVSPAIVTTDAPPKPKPKTPCKVAVTFEIASDPTRGGLGAAWLHNIRENGPGRVIGVSLYRERVLVSRALSKGDTLLLRFLASLIFCEFLLDSRISKTWEAQDILKGLVRHLGGPWSFRVNFSFLATELAKNDLTATLDKILNATTATPWFNIDCQLPAESRLWQWNAGLPKPEYKKKQPKIPNEPTPEGAAK